jgi:streptogrisin C
LRKLRTVAVLLALVAGAGLGAAVQTGVLPGVNSGSAATVLTQDPAAPPEPSAPPVDLLDPATVEESVAYLVAAHQVDRKEALRRLELQRTAAKLDAALKVEAAGEYAGMWIDQQAGGLLMIATTDPTATQARLTDVHDSAHVRTTQVQHTLAQLTATRDALITQLGTGPVVPHLPTISAAENRVVVWERAWADGWSPGTDPLAALDPAVADQVVARAAPPADTTSHGSPNGVPGGAVDPGFCHPHHCTGHGALRGGMRLNGQRDNGTWGGCTAGFNVRSTGGGFPGAAWVLTAGHCVVGKTNNVPLQHNGTPVVEQHGVESNSYPYDYALLPYVDSATATTWLDGQDGRNLVLKHCPDADPGGDAAACGDRPASADQPITGVTAFDSVLVNSVVCASGSASDAATYPDVTDSGAGAGFLSGTRCGLVTSTDVGINTDLCSRAGDSGGPLFDQVNQSALGILEGNLQSRSGPCAAGEVNNYSPVSTILEDAARQLDAEGSTFGVITTPAG